MDELEQWLSSEFEHPGLESIDRLVNMQRMQPGDWKNMIRLVALQDLRTPSNFQEQMNRWKREMPKLMEKTLRESVESFQNEKESDRIPAEGGQYNVFSDLFDIAIVHPSSDSSNDGEVHAEITLGRRLWITSMQHMLRKADVLCRHRWSVVYPPDDLEWPLTDHPMLKLNYYEPGHYDFRGGWNSKGTEIMMPVSPRHLLYVQVGTKKPNRFEFPAEQTRIIQSLLAERAHRWVFCTSPQSWVSDSRPRIIDPKAFADEEAAWQGWHETQSLSESSPNEAPNESTESDDFEPAGIPDVGNAPKESESPPDTQTPPKPDHPPA